MATTTRAATIGIMDATAALVISSGFDVREAIGRAAA
jgi:hypothetical protein